MASHAVAEPREIAHRYGITEVEGTPERIVSLSFIGHDFLLALGVRPIALRYWYGEEPFGVWPWAQAALGDAEPFVFYGEIDIEQVALLQPDLIVGQWSGMTEAEYRLLSQIAPTLPPAEGESDYSSSWQTMTTQLGLALGRVEDAAAIVADLEVRFADIREAHPGWQGRSVVVGWPPRLSIFTSTDIRTRFFQSLGFVSPEGLDDMAHTNAFFLTLPQEALPRIDADLLVWVYSADLEDALDRLVLRDRLSAHQAGREIYPDYVLTAALAHSSPLSLHYALDRILPQIEAAMDGDPETLVDATPRMPADHP